MFYIIVKQKLLFELRIFKWRGDKMAKVSYILERKQLSKPVQTQKQYSDNVIHLCTQCFKKQLLETLILTDKYVECDLGAITIKNDKNKNNMWDCIKITLHEIKEYIFMDAEINKSEQQNIECLERFDSFLQKTINIHLREENIYKDYNVIKTYDYVSSYYCTQLYPMLDEFDRKMRQLLYNIFIINYGTNYKDEINYYTEDGKLKSKKKKRDTRTSDNYLFYCYDYTQFSDILFDHNNNINASYWEYFFKEKTQISDKEAKKDIDQFKDYRNDIAHCKLINKFQYMEANNFLKKYIPIIEKAILYTYSNDFKLKFINELNDSLKTTIENSIKTILQITSNGDD